ncbi:MAG: hypothetical protein HXS50_01995 [Theionarchaea archaeon]|nr:hypothetical protein [Theionarchaea archaeon]
MVLSKKSAACLAFVLLIASTVAAASQVERISGMVIGCVGCNEFNLLFIRDPLFTYTVYPLPPDLPDKDKRKLDRVYYPRTRENLVNTYDIIIFDDARIQHFSTRQIHDLDYGFREGGMSAVIAPVIMWSYVIQPTILNDLVPISEKGSLRYGAYYVAFRRERDPVFLPFVDLGIEKHAGSQESEIVAKQGATVWADIRPRQTPWLVSWTPGGGNPGMLWVLAHRFDDWWLEDNNPYAPDVATNLILYSMGRPLIADIHARREARLMFVSFHMQKSIILSMIEWADSFGANTLALSDRLASLDVGMEEAVDSYLEQDYSATITFLQSISPAVKEIARDVVRLKDEALAWVYMAEWLAVSGTSMVCGFVLWTLMVRRRAYRKVSTTRFM